MVCHCKPPCDGGLGCGEECLNRMLNIECVRGTCPCGDHCSNQQFQERKYAKLKSFKSGKKGYGLCSEEDIGRGQFLIEYVGEVLDMPAYEARQKDYASKGHKHFYFMTLNGSEVIDACSKGNLGRFINHSCEPNCRTEKWMVNGEICIGLFAVRSIKKGEEVTFDYNYVRVFGAAAKKCDCGSSQCRGFIGGDPLNCEVVAHDSEEDDAEDLETVMIDTQSDTIDRTEIISTTKSANVDEIQDAAESSVRESVHIDAHGEIESSMDLSTSSVSLSRQIENANETMHLTRAPFTQHVEDMLSKYSSSSGIDTCMEEKVTNKASKSYKSESSSLTEGPGNSIYECIDANLKTYPDNVEVDQEPPRSSSTKKSAISSSSRKSTNSRFPKVMSKKSALIANKSKKFSDVSCRHEVVVEKLNELLDSGGGISKRKVQNFGIYNCFFYLASKKTKFFLTTVLNGYACLLCNSCT
uniref:Histone-lysine N-methyltransferase ASHH2 n=1 Tax=Kalanchoe fedtschenkoi TaxID=63787 RepID=A0A7N0TNE1_KALFE